MSVGEASGTTSVWYANSPRFTATEGEKSTNYPVRIFPLVASNRLSPREKLCSRMVKLAEQHWGPPLGHWPHGIPGQFQGSQGKTGPYAPEGGNPVRAIGQACWSQEMSPQEKPLVAPIVAVLFE